jgi:hypothetical protein
MDEENLRPNDISIRQDLYRERRNKCTKLSKYSEEVNAALDDMSPINTCSSCKWHESEIVIFGTFLNLQFLCEKIKDIYADGTFKCCPKYLTVIIFELFYFTISIFLILRKG